MPVMSSRSSGDLHRGPNTAPRIVYSLFSSVGVMGGCPWKDNLPVVGLNPKSPEKSEGILTLPPISLPIPNGLHPEAINEASPPLEPPEVLVVL